MKLFIFFENSKLIFFTWLEELNPPFSTWLRELFFFWIWLKVFLNGLEESNPFFFNTTQRIEPFLKCDFFQWYKELNLFFGKITQRIGLDSKTWTLCFSNLIQRIGLILMIPRLEASFLNYDTFFEKKKLLKELDQFFLTQRNDFFVWLKELILLYDSKNCFFCMTQRIETFFFEYDAENWTLFFENDAENWILFLFLPQRIETFSSLPQIIELFFQKILLTQRIERFCLIWLKEMKSEKMTQRVELVF